MKSKRFFSSLFLFAVMFGVFAEKKELPYFVCGPTIGLKDKDPEKNIKKLKAYKANAVIGFGLPSKGKKLIEELSRKGVLVFEDSHSKHLRKDDLNKLRQGQYPFCMAGEYQEMWLRAIPSFVKESKTDVYCVTLDEIYWNNLFFGYGLDRKYCEDQPAYSYSEKFKKGYKDFCGKYEKKYNLKLQLPQTGRSRILKDNTIASRCFIQYRYKVFAEAIRDRIEAVNKADPSALTCAIFSAVPVFAMERYPSGIAWDIVGQTAKPDIMIATAFQTFQDYKGKDTHLFLTETACRLVAANRPRAAGIVMANYDNCEKDSERNTNWFAGHPRRYERVKVRKVDILGQAISYAAHGLRGIFCYNPGPVEKSRGKWLAETYGLLKEIEPLVKKSKIPEEIALVVSRASQDFYSLYRNSKRHLNADDDGSEAMRQVRGWAQPSNSIAYDYNKDNEGSLGFRQQKKLTHLMINEALPFEMFYLEQLDAKELKAFKTIVLPFPFSISQKNVKVLEKLAQEGKNIVIHTACGETDDDGNNCITPQGGGALLLKLIGLKNAPAQVEEEQDLVFSENSPVMKKESFKGLPLPANYPESAILPGTEILAKGSNGGLGILKRKCGKGAVYFIAFPLEHTTAGKIISTFYWHLCSPENLIKFENGKPDDAEFAIRNISETEKLLFIINWGNKKYRTKMRFPISDGQYVFESYSTIGKSGFSQPLHFSGGGMSIEFDLKPDDACVLHVRKK